MSLLLDTHVLVWWLQDSARLGPQAKRRIADPEILVWVSAASAWEIAIKAGLGRIRFAEPPEVCLPRALEDSGFRALPVSLDHTLAVRTLGRHHGDSFDRLLVAQALAEGLRIVTADVAFAAYGVATLPAGR